MQVPARWTTVHTVGRSGTQQSNMPGHSISNVLGVQQVGVAAVV